MKPKRQIELPMDSEPDIKTLTVSGRELAGTLDELQRNGWLIMAMAVGPCRSQWTLHCQRVEQAPRPATGRSTTGSKANDAS